MTAIRYAIAIALIVAAGLAIGSAPRSARVEAAPLAIAASPSSSPSAAPTVAPTVNPARVIPSCDEDEAIVGFGDFHHGGYWDRYECVNVAEIAKDVDPAAGDEARAMAQLALDSATEPWAVEFTEPLLADCRPVVTVGTFIGCEHDDPSLKQTDYAGLIWLNNLPVYAVGP